MRYGVTHAGASVVPALVMHRIKVTRYTTRCVMTNWSDLVLSSHYDATVAIREAIERGDVRDAMVGLEELIYSMSRSQEDELYSACRFSWPIFSNGKPSPQAPEAGA